jgi:hypothetical protein
MNYIALIFLAFIFWILGYVAHKVMRSWERKLLVPRWFYILCGSPRIKNLPYGTLSLQGAVTQSIGYLLILYGIMNKIFLYRYIRYPLGLVGCILIGVCVIPFPLYWMWKYKGFS